MAFPHCPKRVSIPTLSKFHTAMYLGRYLSSICTYPGIQCTALGGATTHQFNLQSLLYTTRYHFGQLFFHLAF